MKNTAIESLSLAQCGLTPAALKAILQAPFVSKLKEINVMDNLQLGDKGALVLAQANMKYLNTLNIRNTGLKLAGFRALSEANWPYLKKIIYWERVWAPNAFDRRPQFGFEMAQNNPADVDDGSDEEMEEVALEGSEGKDAATEALKAAQWWNQGVELHTEWDEAKAYHGMGGAGPNGVMMGFGGGQECVVM